MVHWMNVPRSDNARGEQDSLEEFPGVIKEGQRLMIIELENYNSAEEISIEKGNTELLGLV